MAQIGYILRSYPRLSQTFIVNEIRALEQIGLAIRIFAITDPREPIVQPQVAQVRAPVEYLDRATRRGPAGMLAEHLRGARANPRGYAAALRYVAQRPALDAGYRAGSRYACLAHALYLARLLRQARSAGSPVTHLHAHFAHDPALIAYLARLLTGISYSFTAHARDLYQTDAAALAERIAAASAVVTCCAPNLGYLAGLGPRADIRLIHHGVDLSGFRPIADDGASAAPGAAGDPAPLILSVGRLVEKKGFPDLLRACGRLAQAGRRFRCEIYGDGPLRAELAALIDDLGLAGQVVLAGARRQDELLPVFQRADIFALAPFVTDDGDRDGIPNVLVEAMACALPVVATDVAGIPELVQHERNGLLAAPRDPDALADALAALLGDRERRRRMGAAARSTVVERFDLRAAARQLQDLFAHAAPDAIRSEAAPPKPDRATARV